MLNNWMPDRYRFGWKYHLKVGLLVLAGLLVYWFGVVVPAKYTHRHDIWITLILVTLIFYANFLQIWPWATLEDKVSTGKALVIVMLNVLSAIGVSVGISMIFGNLEVSFSGARPSDFFSLFDGSVPNFYAYFLPQLGALAMSYAGFYVEWTHGPFANRKNWQRQLQEARIAWRRAQLDPHLLDTHLVLLSAITRESKAKAQLALDYTIRVVHFYIGGNDPGKKIRLTDEIDCVRCLMEIQRIRFGAALNWRLLVGNGLEGIEIIAITVMAFAENMVRYAVLNSATDAATLAVRLMDGNLVISGRNRIRIAKGRHGSGTGLSNLEERLEFAYPNRYGLESRIENGWYGVELVIYGILS